MKNIIAILVIFFFVAVPAFGATPTEEPDQTPTPTEQPRRDSLSDQINDLKNKIASRVAELNLVDKRGIIGTVQEVKNTQITITDPQEQTRIIDVDAITKFSSSSAKSSFGISDITKGTTISVIGLYNKQSRRILARFVESTTVPQFVSGTITDVNKPDFSFTVTDADGKKKIIDVENFTKTNTYTKDDEMVKTGFSKMTAGTRAVVTGYPSKTDTDRLTGLRILLLPEVAGNTGAAGTEENTTDAAKNTPTP